MGSAAPCSRPCSSALPRVAASASSSTSTRTTRPRSRSTNASGSATTPREPPAASSSAAPSAIDQYSTVAVTARWSEGQGGRRCRPPGALSPTMAALSTVEVVGAGEDEVDPVVVVPVDGRLAGRRPGEGRLGDRVGVGGAEGVDEALVLERAGGRPVDRDRLVARLDRLLGPVVAGGLVEVAEHERRGGIVGLRRGPLEQLDPGPARALGEPDRLRPRCR